MDLSKLKKAESYINSGKLAQAEKVLRKFLEKNKNVPNAWIMLASVYGQTGRFSEVASAAKKVISINPEHAEAYSLLGSAYVYLGHLDEAIDALETANRLMPSNIGALNNLGNTYYAAGKYDDAERCYRHALDIDVNYPQSNFGLANCCLAKCLWVEAVQYFQKAYNAMSDSYDINMSLGMAYLNLANHDMAYTCIERAVGLTDAPSAAYCELANLAQLTGELEKALGLVEKSLHHDKANIKALAKRAEIYYKLGRVDEAHAEIEYLVKDNKIAPSVLLVWGAMCHKFDDCKEVMDRIEAMLKENKISQSDHISLGYMLGSLYDKQGDYDNAFMHYCNANSTLESKFDRERIIKLADNLIADFNAESIKQITNSGCDDERPVFIVGMPRSGTSLVEQILSSHPQIYGAGELSDIKNIAISYIQATRSNNAKIFSHTERAKLFELAGKYQKVIEQTCGNAIRVTDKMPSNFLWLGFIMQLFPKARIIHCKRDPRDTCLSIYFQQFTKSHDYANKLEDLSFYYRQYERLVHHWKYHLHVPMLDVYYKDLVLDIETKARQLVDYLGLQWDDRCLAYYESKRATATASWDQVRQPIYTKSLGRWRHYQKYLGPLLDEFGSDEAALSIATEKICKQA